MSAGSMSSSDADLDKEGMYDKKEGPGLDEHQRDVNQCQIS
jgi:hypothetical protein